MNSQFLIDKNGEVLSAYDEGLVEKFGYPMPDFDLASYAVRNLGAVSVDIHQGSATAILRFRWLTVSDRAIDAACRLLLGNALSKVVIHCETHQWTDHQFQAPQDAVAWLEANRSGALGTAQKRSSHLVTAPRELKSIAERPLGRVDLPDDHFSLIFKKWRLAQGKFSNQITDTLVRFGDLDRAVVAREKDDGRIVFEHIGSRITIYDRTDDSWTFRFSGRPVSDQPDTKYGQYTEKVFREAINRGEPKFDHLDAVVHDGHQSVRFQYDRLLLPWQLSDGERILTSLSFKTSPDASAV